MSMEFKFHGYRACKTIGGEDGGGIHIHQDGRNVTINGKPVRGLRKWMVYTGVALAWLGLLAAIPLLAFIVLLLGCVGWAVYILTR